MIQLSLLHGLAALEFESKPRPGRISVGAADMLIKIVWSKDSHTVRDPQRRVQRNKPGW